MKYKKLGNTDLDVSLICLGTMTWGTQNSEKDAVEQMDYSASKGINFCVDLQNDKGTIPWCLNENGLPGDDFFITGSSSILKSLECAIALFNITQDTDKFKLSNWQSSYLKLKKALRNPEGLFDIKIDRTRFSMDWYYPVLSSALSHEQAEARLAARWDDFVIDGFGCRCVVDEPWVTVAETAELIMALVAHGQHEKAAEMLGWLAQFRDENGAYWMGMQVEQKAFWPVERPAWTAGAVILAHDAVLRLTPAHHVLTGG